MGCSARSIVPGARLTRGSLRPITDRFRRLPLDKETAYYLGAMQDMQKDRVIDAKLQELADRKISVCEFRAWLGGYEAKRIGD